MIPRLSVLPLALVLVGCQSFEVTNDSRAEVEVRIGSEGMFDSTDPADLPSPFRLDPGETVEKSVNIPANVDVAVIQANGDWVNLTDTVPLASEGATAYTIVDNAGAARLTNTGTTPIESIHFTSTFFMEDDWVFGLGDWGDDLGPIAPGESIELMGLFPGEDYAVKFDGTVRVAPQYTITVGEFTEVSVNADDEDDEEDEG